MIEGICTKCDTHRFGWALLNPRYQACPSCGEGLDIYKDGILLAKGFSPFSANRLNITELQSENSSPLNLNINEDDK